MKNAELIDKLRNCTTACNHCADACLDNQENMVDCIRTDRVCAEVCQATANVLSTSFENVDGLVSYCMEICKSCGSECAKHDHDHCQKCAEACKKCAEACQQFLN